MSNQFGPIEIYCDAPPIPIVQGCERLGFHSPMDVRWRRLSHLLAEQDKRQKALGLSLWKSFVSTTQLQRKICSCGEPLPCLEWYTFTFRSGQFTYCCLGQCVRCRTIFWDEG
jgi:hypothetical protein